MMDQQNETPRQVLRRVLAVWRCLAAAEKAYEAELLASQPVPTNGGTSPDTFSTHRIQRETTERVNQAFKELGSHDELSTEY